MLLQEVDTPRSQVELLLSVDKAYNSALGAIKLEEVGFYLLLVLSDQSLVVSLR